MKAGVNETYWSRHAHNYIINAIFSCTLSHFGDFGLSAVACHPYGVCALHLLVELRLRRHSQFNQLNTVKLLAG